MGGAFEPFERIVRTVTGNEEYAFGDIAKSVVGATAQGVEGTVRSVTRNEDYQFGDLTRKVVGATTHGVEGRRLYRGDIPSFHPLCTIRPTLSAGQ